MKHSTPIGQKRKSGEYTTYTSELREVSSIINSTVVMAKATGITKDHNSGLLAERWGSISITKTWAKSLLNRMGWVKLKGTKAVYADFISPQDNLSIQYAESNTTSCS